ncbi:Na/Pi symporter [Acidimicrobiia bacterium EGI L10123]|uniref:Na/Pi symporter n=1 Tax=Salinilacustrithrix flava TaxID=2957203 RepID=UPI003D7C14D2|nr:Na/Pi symporter [Acidimicrobiia bacterium EGI L10123]
MVSTRPSTTDAATERPVPAPIRAAVVVALLFLFLVGVGLLESGINALGSDVQEELFSSVSNPMAGLFVGILATVLAQSSSVTTSTIVGLVGAGLLGIDDAVPMIMGANIGTTVTNTLASLGHLRRPAEFRLAFAAATVHDAFNLLAVSILLPIELLTGVLSSAARFLTELLLGGSGAEFDSPFKAAVKVPVGWVEELWGDVVGLQGTLLGVMLVVTGLAAIFLALTFVTRNMRQLIAARVERSINAMLGKGGGAPAILLGIIITVAVQSSSITTSIMIPLSAAGVVSLANAYPVTLGANVGTTISALLASLATDRPEALTVALVHTLFNLAGILLFYPVPALRRLPIRIAEWLAEMAARRRSMVIGYVIVTFLVIPAIGVILLR